MLTFEYDERLPTLRRLIRLANRAQWSVEDVDWSVPLPDRGKPYERVLSWHGLWRNDYIQTLPPKKTEALARQMVAMEFSQVLHGEQAALMLAGQLTTSVQDLDARIFAATQAKDEARHVEAVRDLVKRLGPIYPIGKVLQENLHDLLTCNLWPKQVLGLQLFLEARALLSFRQHLLFVNDPVFTDVVTRIERDEAHHVAFGVQYLKNGVADLGPETRALLIDYAQHLDRTIWHMTQAEEFRAAFDEVDLDYDECMANQERSFTSPHLTPDAQRTVADMYTQFVRWFENAVRRVGLGEAIADRPIASQEPGPDTLPWVAAADAAEAEAEAEVEASGE